MECLYILIFHCSNISLCTPITLFPGILISENIHKIVAHLSTLHKIMQYRNTINIEANVKSIYASLNKALVIPRKQWLPPDMTEKLLTVTLSINTNKQTISTFPILTLWKLKVVIATRIHIQLEQKQYLCRGLCQKYVSKVLTSSLSWFQR